MESIPHKISLEEFKKKKQLSIRIKSKALQNQEKEQKEKNNRNELLKEEFNKNISLVSGEVKSIHEKNPPHKEKKHLDPNDLVIIRRIGKGSCGEVFLAKDFKLNRTLAIKKIIYKGQEKELNSIKNEINLNCKLKNPHILKCYKSYIEVGEIPTIVLVLEVMDKGSLDKICEYKLKKNQKIPEDYLGIIVNHIIHGLFYFQSKEGKIIHRDLKPSNILINSKGEAKISDFGVSTSISETWEMKTTMVGTYKYMAPERIVADVYYQNCDIWSLGVIIWECCCGFYPFKMFNNMKEFESIWKLKEIIDKYKVPPPAINGYSNELVEFIRLCLIKNPLERPLAKDLMENPFIKKYENFSKDNFIEWMKDINI